MFSFYEEADVKANRQKFMQTGKYEECKIRFEVGESWQRCLGMDLDPAIISVQTPLRPIIVKQDMSFLRDHVLSELVTDLYQTLDRHQSALFWAYDNGTIFSQRGNSQFLKYLNSLNIGIGTNLGEDFLGTTGFTLVKKPLEDQFVIGEEHYLDILTPYVTYCYLSSDFNAMAYAFLIFPKEQFDEDMLRYLQLFHKARRIQIEKHRTELELLLKEEFLDTVFQTPNRAVLFVDNLGKIINASKTFCQWFNVEQEQIINSDCIDIFPELERAVACLEDGRSICYEEIFFANAPTMSKFVRMDVSPIIVNEITSGLIINFLNAKIQRRHHKSTGNNAHFTFDDILGEAKVMQDLKTRALRASSNNSSVILTGESGTGKELFAQAIHNAGPRKDEPFVAINCAATTPELVTSELFGYVEGAFTGAKRGGAMGKFEYAHDGTLFLDEIGDMPLYAQSHLLRVLETQAVTRVGGNIATPINVRIICATNRDLKKMVDEGKFREDLYYRINVNHLYIPSLRERAIDIPILVDNFIGYYNNAFQKQVMQVDKEAMLLLMNYSWPGNIRQLRNVIETVMNNVDGDVLTLKNFAELGLEEKLGKINEPNIVEYQQESNFANEERNMILHSLLKHNGNKSLVAKELGMSRSTLYKRLDTYKII